jgi:hypothetical protein
LLSHPHSALLALLHLWQGQIGTADASVLAGDGPDPEVI